MSGFANLDILGSDISDTASIGLVLEAFLYGLYCFIFGQYLQVRLQKKKEERSILVYPLTMLFLLSTLYFIINLPQTFWLVLRPGTHHTFIWNVNIISCAIYGFVDFISQAILIYRCWILWDHLSLVCVPIIMALTFLELCRQSQLETLANIPPWAIPLAISSLCISLALNAIVTGLLVLKIAIVLTRSRRSRGHADPRLYDLSPVISILIETGMATFVSQLLLVIVFGLESISATVIVGTPIVMIYGMTPTIVIVRVSMGPSYDSRASRTLSSITFATNQDVQTEVVTAETSGPALLMLP
ncbi:hypothetical protein BYT27DRAFT_7304753 [Phlegmacium glaucopus]|nr:hypothetical protein BYT27DRAFT_7304753 [Phlegmacium glaucopus]